MSAICFKYLPADVKWSSWDCFAHMKLKGLMIIA